MKRIIEHSLLSWKDSPRRKPLIVRGARQVGKTYSIEEFGRNNFDSYVKVDLERNRDWHRVFQGDLEARRILAELEVLLNRTVSPGASLLFLDEIQSCPDAIMALRYFYEELPDLHVVAAGSLIEFVLKEISFPVGRVQFLEMHPMTFAEFLWAVGEGKAADVVLGEPGPVPESVHHHILEELKKYFFIGGMPEAVRVHQERGSIHEALNVHGELCETYRHDFPKYAGRADPNCLDAVLLGVARNLGKRIKYSRLSDEFAHTTVKRAFHMLSKARVIRPVPSANPRGLPLGAMASVKRFKAIMVDIGLWHYLSGMRADRDYGMTDLLEIYRGVMAEHFVGQEITASKNSDLYYWSREAKSSSAEVDYLFEVGGKIWAVEVKSGPAGRLRSLHKLLQTYPNCAGGLVFSSAPYAELPERKLTFLPLYFAYSATGSGASGPLV